MITINRFTAGGLLLICLLTSGCQTVFFSHLNTSIDKTGYSVESGIEFSQPYRLKLDIYKPAQALAGTPVVVFFYGGSWRSGKRGWYEFVGAALARRGILAIIPDYRTYSDVTFPHFMSDAAQATAWARNNAQDYGGDPNNLFLAGHSAGAHIAVLLASDDTYLKQAGYSHQQLAGVIGLAGPYDFLPLKSKSLRRVFPGAINEQSSQPINFASKDDPPMLLLHGQSDNRVWESNSISMSQALLNAGGRAFLRTYPGVGHVDILMSLAEHQQQRSPAFQDMLAFITDRMSFQISMHQPE